jgi:hypothetical protein
LQNYAIWQFGPVARKIPIGHHQINLAIRLQRRQGFNAVAGEQQADRPILDLLAELILPQAGPVRLPSHAPE